MTPKALMQNDIVNLSIEYPSYFTRHHPHLADYASTIGLDGWRVRIGYRQRYFTLVKDGIVLDAVPRHLIIAGRD